MGEEVEVVEDSAMEACLSIGSIVLGRLVGGVVGAAGA